jgi:hypothetical protein
MFSLLLFGVVFSQGGRMEAEREAAALQRFPYRRSDRPRQPLQRFLLGRCESTDEKRIVRPGKEKRGEISREHQLTVECSAVSQIEFIVRRIPFGRVFHLRREAEGQSLGIVTEAGGGAEIREVVAGGLAAQQGVPPMAMSPLTLISSASSPMPCSWTLTEINGRPLNLCSKEGEARDRLNAVGKAVSILIQPTEFVKLLKKQIKSIRGYKDYLLG